MAENTAISWARHTWNPWMGCTKISPACDGCYAAHLMDTRLGKVKWGPHGERVRTSAQNWRLPMKWQRQAEKDGDRPFVFCASLADIFDNQVPPEWRRDAFDTMRVTPNLVYLLLTKRPQNIVRLFRECMSIEGGAEYTAKLWPRNAAIGTTVEDQDRFDLNVPALRKARRLVDPAFAFLSCEPLLGPLSGSLHDIDWVITGGETDQGSHKARPTNPQWFRSLRDQCGVAGVPFHFKQWGEYGPTSDANGPYMARFGKDRTGRHLDGREWLEFPKVAA